MSVLDIDKKITRQSMVKMGLSPRYSSSFLSEWTFCFIVEQYEKLTYNVYLLKFSLWKESGVCNPSLTIENHGGPGVPKIIEMFPPLTDETELFAFFEHFKNEYYWPNHEHIRS